MANVDTDPFGEHELRQKRKNQPMNVFLFLQLPQEYKLGNQHVNRKCSLEEEKAKELNS